MKEMEKALLDWERDIKFQGYKSATFTESAPVRNLPKEISPAIATKHILTERLARITSIDPDSNPFRFFVRFSEDDNDYTNFQRNLQSFMNQLQPFKNIPLVGGNCTIVIKNELFRATVIRSENSPENEVTIHLLESGSEVTVKWKDLLRLPRELLDIPPYAKEFTLADYKRHSTPQDQHDALCFYLQYVFKQKDLTLKLISTNSEYKSEYSDETFNLGSSLYSFHSVLSSLR